MRPELTMRALVILLLLLASAKLAFQEYLFRAGTRDAVLEAYRSNYAASPHTIR